MKNKKGNLIVLPAGKEAESPSNPFSSVQFSSNIKYVWCGGDEWWVVKRYFRVLLFGPNLGPRLEAGTKLNNYAWAFA